MFPFLTSDIPALNCAIKTCDEDFIVEEIPLYEPSGQGTHVYALIGKKGISTPDALAQIARVFGIPRWQIGFAGQKDARAVTRQWISIEHIKPEQLLNLDIPKIKVLSVTRHGNKLKLGHLAGNRFVIRLRKLQIPVTEAAAIAKNVLTVLSGRGVPNYFGTQRFGNRNTGHLLGEAIAKDRIDEFVDIFLGRAAEGDDFTTEARSLYEKSDYEKAHDAWPYSFSNERRAIKVLVKSGGKKNKAFDAVDKRLKSFFISAYQSDIFNQVLAARMPNIDKLLTGDMAYKHINGACFRVEDAAKEQPRCDSFEISPTGPILGHRTTLLTDAAGEIENAVISRMQLQENDLRRMQKYGAKGGRRPLRFMLKDLDISTGEDQLGPYLELEFELDSGCYATTALREITKSDL